MTGCCTTAEKANDLISKKAAWLLWYIPAAAVLFGFVMGAGCLANATRCGRLHCYLTGPVYILAALYVALSLFGVIHLNPGLFLLIVLGASCLAVCLEAPFGRYKAKGRL